MLYYVFETEEIAVGAEQYICQVGNAPVPSVIPSNNIVDPEATHTERWAIPWQRVTDNRWVFPYVGDETASQYPQHIRDYFAGTYPHTLEEYDDSWLPPSLDEQEDTEAL